MKILISHVILALGLLEACRSSTLATLMCPSR
jgi:hypothetical protein